MRLWAWVLALGAAEEMARVEADQRSQGARKSESAPNSVADQAGAAGATYDEEGNKVEDKQQFNIDPTGGLTKTDAAAMKKGVHVGANVGDDALIVKPYEDVAAGAMKHLIKILDRAASQVDFITEPAKFKPMTPLEKAPQEDKDVTYVNFVKLIKEAVAIRGASHRMASAFQEKLEQMQKPDEYGDEPPEILQLAREMTEGSMRRFGAPLDNDPGMKKAQSVVERELFVKRYTLHDQEALLKTYFGEWKRLRLLIDNRSGQDAMQKPKGLLQQITQLLTKFRDRVEGAALGLRWAQRDMQEMLEALRERERQLAEAEFVVDDDEEEKEPEDGLKQAKARSVAWAMKEEDQCNWVRECAHSCSEGSAQCAKYDHRPCPPEDRIDCTRGGDPATDCDGAAFSGDCKSYAGMAVTACAERCTDTGLQGCSEAQKANWNSAASSNPFSLLIQGERGPVNRPAECLAYDDQQAKAKAHTDSLVNTGTAITEKTCDPYDLAPWVWLENWQKSYGAYCPYGYMSCDKILTMDQPSQITIVPSRNQLAVELQGFNFPKGADVHRGCLHAFLVRTVTGRNTALSPPCTLTTLDDVTKKPDCHNDPKLPCNFAESSGASSEAATQLPDRAMPQSVVFYFEGPNDRDRGLLHGGQWVTGDGGAPQAGSTEDAAGVGKGTGEGPVIFDICVMQPPMKAPDSFVQDHQLEKTSALVNQPMQVFHAGQLCVCFVNKKRHIYKSHQDYKAGAGGEDFDVGTIRLQPCVHKSSIFDASSNQPFCVDAEDNLHANNKYDDRFNPYTAR